MLPEYLAPIFKMQNIAVLIGISALCAIVPFLCLEAMHGTGHKAVERSHASFCAYYCSVVPFRRNEQTGAPIPVAKGELLRRTNQVGFKFMLTVALFSALRPYHYSPFPSPRNGESFIHLTTMFHWGHLLNNFLVAAATSVELDFGSSAVGLLVSSATGLSTIEVFRSPLTRSTSPSDFWGHRWNLMIQRNIKRGVYMPLRRILLSTYMAGMVAFLVSGLLHEIILNVVSLRARLYPHVGRGYVPKHGNHLLFFVWNGAVLVLEYLTRDHPVVVWMSRNLPQPLITCLVLLMVLPMSHLFTDEYLRSGFYDDFAMSVPIVAKL